MEIWEERYTNAKGQKESKKGFDLFQIYLDMPLPRQLTKFVSQQFFNGDESTELKKSRKFIRKYNSVYKSYQLYDWDERATAHDVWLRRQNDEALVQMFNEFRAEQFPKAVERVNSLNERFEKINHNNTEIVVTKEGLKERPKRDSDRTRSEKENQESYSLALDDAIKLFTGGVVKTETKSKVDVTSKGRKLFGDKETYHKQIVSDLEDLLE